MIDYFEFKGRKYGIGTLVKVPRSTDLRYVSKEWLIVEAEFIGKATFSFTSMRGWVCLYESAGHLSGKYEEYIEIIKPVYYEEQALTEAQNIFLRTGSGSWDSHNEVCVGFIWYIIVMLVAVIFKDRLTIWAFATIVYFIWKSKK